MRKIWPTIFITVILLASINSVSAAVITYSGSDDGASTSGPWVNSAAAESQFISDASSIGPLNTITFEDETVGYNTNFTVAPNVSVALTGSDFGSGYSGISSTTVGSLYGFNTTTGGNNWLGFPAGTATFTFDLGTQIFGMYLTGLQTTFGTNLTASFFDGTSQILNLPVNIDGGAQYFGFTDVGTLISEITITNLSNDAWGIDDITYTSAAPVPEPSTILLLGGGLLGLGWYGRKRKQA